MAQKNATTTGTLTTLVSVGETVIIGQRLGTIKAGGGSTLEDPQLSPIAGNVSWINPASQVYQGDHIYTVDPAQTAGAPALNI